MYPTLQAFADTAVSNYFASIIVLADGDTPEAVKSPFFYGSANQAIWTSSDNLYFNDGKVYSTAQGPAWVTKSYGKWSYTWNLNVAALTSVDTTKASKTIAGRSYYDLNGRSVAVSGCRCLHPGHALHRWQHNCNQGGAVAVVYLIYS